jgi:hypothetical protein
MMGMEINRTSRTDSSSVRRTAKQAGGSENVFNLADVQPQRAAAISGPGTIAAVESILTLQGLDDSTGGRSKGVVRGEQLLDMLDEVRDGLLCGGIPRATLNRLAAVVAHRHETFADPKLQTVLDEIELRARVELAKLEQVDRLAS